MTIPVLSTLLVLLVPAAVQTAPAPAASRCDVLVYGGTPGGIAAAIAASRGGARVVLVEPTQHVGGLVTSGLSHTDFRTYEGLNGLFLDFVRRVEAHYRQAYGAQSEQVRACRRGTQAEPHVNERVFEQMLTEQPSLTVYKGLRLASLQLGETADTRRTITRVAFATADADGGRPAEFAARVFIDATYEGDLMARAGVAYRVGREGRGEYQEALAPEQADSQLQAYNFRLVMTRDPALRVPVEQPAGYQREDFAAILPLLEREGGDARIKTIFNYPAGCIFKAQLPALPNGKFDINDVSGGVVRLSLPGENRDWPEGDAAARARVFATHLRSTVGLLWFLQNDRAVPASLRDEARAWGWCNDEFTDNGHIPWQLYVREARRMVGTRVFTERDTAAAPGDARSVFQTDAIAMGDYGPNCHGTAHEKPRFGGRHTGEFYKRVAPYQVAYSVLVPRERDNLLVPVACSASHVGFCALRLEPIWMALGQAAGVAARVALSEQGQGQGPIAVATVSVPRVQHLLHIEGAATIYVADVPPGAPGFAAVQWLGARGGLHGLAPAGNAPGQRGPNIEGQYYAAFPGHAFEPDRPVDDALLQRWIALLDQAAATEARRTLAADGPLTRGQAAARLFALAEREEPRVVVADVCVYGGTSGGVVAAVQAARMGKRVILAEPGEHLGGMSSGGLGWTDFGGKTGKAEIGGLAREFYRRVGRHYGCDEEFTLEPRVAELVFDDWVKEAGVTVLFKQRIAAVEKQRGRIRAIVMEDGTVHRASMFLDTTYEGDLMARSGVSYVVGREANAQYGETLNGRQGPATNPRAGKFEVRLDPYVVPGDPASGLLPLLLQPGTLGEPGTADPLVQSYNYRVCLTDRDVNKLPLRPPANYDPASYELLARWIEARVARGETLTLSSFCKYDPLPNGKFDFNNRWPISTDYIGGALSYPEAGFAERAAIARRHEDYLRGFFCFLATSPRVPGNVRREMQAFGLCKDEFVRGGGWPHQLYVREARRLVSDFVMTQHHCQGKAAAPNSVGLAAYGIDIHAVRRIVHQGQPVNEGSNGGSVPRPYPIAYASLVPKAAECENLFVTFGLSASHVAFASIRMEPVFMVLSQSAATAACLAIDNGVRVQDLPYDGLRARLLADGQVLAWPLAARPEQGSKAATPKLP